MNKKNAFYETSIPSLTNLALSSARSPSLRFAESQFDATALPTTVLLGA
jgi:hypothetical protein